VKVAKAVSALLSDEEPKNSENPKKSENPEEADIMVYLSQAFLKPANKGQGTSWHQDNAYFQVSDGTKGTAMWTAIHDATIANGCLHVAEGYQSAGILPHSRDLGGTFF
jgi:hypothetical protein